MQPLDLPENISKELAEEITQSREKLSVLSDKPLSINFIIKDNVDLLEEFKNQLSPELREKFPFDKSINFSSQLFLVYDISKMEYIQQVLSLKN